MTAPVTRLDFAPTANASFREPPSARLARRVADALARVLSAPRRRATLAELGALTDRELADIGLTRGELRQVFRREFVVARERSRLPF